jgi:uncharacterized phage protein gp47/JayE
MLTLDDLVSIDAAGYHYADYPTFLLYEIQGYQAIYGTDAVLTPDTQDGQRLGAQAQAKYDAAAKGAMVYLSLSPASAQGAGLARLVKINGLTKNIPTNSTVSLVIVGTSGTPIINGIAIDTLQQQWVLPTPITIPGSGTITVTATAALPGSINAIAATVTGIFTPTLGWQTVSNPSAATPGAPVETDGALRIRQAGSTSLPAQTVFDALVGAVENVTGVEEVGAYENDTNSTNSNGVPAHNLCFVVSGGIASAIATAIMLKKTPGVPTYGTTSVALVDPNGVPITINFYIPTNAEIGVQVTLTTGQGWSTDYEALIQAAVSAAVLAVPIGGKVILTQLYLAAYLPNTAAYGSFEVDSIELQKNSGGFGTSDIQLLFNEIPTCSPSIDVVVIP